MSTALAAAPSAAPATRESGTMHPMNDGRTARTSLVAVMLAVTVTAAAPSRLDTYTFTDEITGLAIDLPSAWDRRDLRRMGATLSPSADEYLRRRHDSPVLGDIILIAPGERIPLDGLVLAGEGDLDTAAVTGEAMPASVRKYVRRSLTSSSAITTSTADRVHRAARHRRD